MNDNKGQMGKKICSNTFALMAFTILTGFNIFLHQMMMLSFMAGSNFKIELLIQIHALLSNMPLHHIHTLYSKYYSHIGIISKVTLLLSLSFILNPSFNLYYCYLQNKNLSFSPYLSPVYLFHYFVEISPPYGQTSRYQPSAVFSLLRK